jgi:hypothetical protein
MLPVFVVVDSASESNKTILTTAAGVGVTLDIIKWLDLLPDHPSFNPGPGYCYRLSCVGSSQVWLCNDNAELLHLGSYGMIARAIEDIARQCFWMEKDGSHLNPVTGGQIFEPAGWNVIVKSGPESCK